MNILVVDSSRVMRQITRRMLRRAGFRPKRVVEATHQQQALRILGSFRPDVVLADWDEQSVDGLALLDALRERGDATPVALVTTECTAQRRLMAMKAGAAFLLAKPFSPETMRSTLREQGFEPTRSVRPGVPVNEAPPDFGAHALSSVLSRLIDLRVRAAIVQPVPVASVPQVAAYYTDDQGRLTYVALCDRPVAMGLAGRLGLRTSTTVIELASAGRVTDTLAEDMQEVFNVLTRLFNDAGGRHVRLCDVRVEGPCPVMTLPASTRRDYQLQLGLYGAGRLSFLSTSPEFLAYAS